MTQDSSVRSVPILLWGMTVVVVILLINFAVGVLRHIGLL